MVLYRKLDVVDVVIFLIFSYLMRKPTKIWKFTENLFSTIFLFLYNSKKMIVVEDNLNIPKNILLAVTRRDVHIYLIFKLICIFLSNLLVNMVITFFFCDSERNVCRNLKLSPNTSISNN